jgi:hypothetical protein
MAVPTGRLKHSGQIMSQIMSVPGVVVSGRLMAVPVFFSSGRLEAVPGFDAPR